MTLWESQGSFFHWLDFKVTPSEGGKEEYQSNSGKSRHIFNMYLLCAKHYARSIMTNKADGTLISNGEWSNERQVQ